MEDVCIFNVGFRQKSWAGIVHIDRDQDATVRIQVGYLEHSRIFVSGRGEAERVFLGSGDLLNRNTQRRAEAFVEVATPVTRRQGLEVMEALRRDDVKGWDMQPDGTYCKAEFPQGADSQEYLFDYFSRQRVEPLPPETPERQGFFARLKRGIGQ